MEIKFREWDCELLFRQYGNDRTALQLFSQTEGPIAVATVNIPEIELASDEVIIKDCAENEGMLATLVAAGVVEDTGRMVTSEFVICPIARLLVTPQ